LVADQRLGAVNTAIGVVDALLREDVRAVRGMARDWAETGRPLADMTAAILLFDQRPARSIEAAGSYLSSADHLAQPGPDRGNGGLSQRVGSAQTDEGVTT
jgi:hypothetical protein